MQYLHFCIFLYYNICKDTLNLGNRSIIWGPYFPPPCHSTPSFRKVMQHSSLIDKFLLLMGCGTWHAWVARWTCGQQACGGGSSLHKHTCRPGTYEPFTRAPRCLLFFLDAAVRKKIIISAHFVHVQGQFVWRFRALILNQDFND